MRVETAAGISLATSFVSATVLMLCYCHHKNWRASSKQQPVVREEITPPSWRSFNMESNQVEDSTAEEEWFGYDENIDQEDDGTWSTSCKTEKEFLCALEERVSALRWNTYKEQVRNWLNEEEEAIKPPDVPTVASIESKVNEFTIWEYRDLFAPNRKVDMTLFEEFSDFRRISSSLEDDDQAENVADAAAHLQEHRTCTKTSTTFAPLIIKENIYNRKQ